MLGTNYKVHKKNVLNIFNAYKDYRGDINDGVNIEFLQQRIDSLANSKFTLAVAGEVKAGKSTFLNALLRQELLPTDVLQATSAVIEIFKSDKNCLRITYADSTKEEFTNDCKEKLKEICSVNDEFRDIPFTQINTYIKNSENLLFSDLDINEMEKVSKISGLGGKRDIIEKYIKETPKSKLPISISLGYPLEWDFDELRLVDSPGINATGGVENLSYEYFTKANAIIFVHPIKPIESKSFRDFVTEVIPDKIRENLFLVLTHSDQQDDEEVERLTNEAKKLYGKHIDEKHIVAVDSILSLIHSDLENGISLQTIRDENRQKKKAIASHKEVAEDEGKELVDVLRDASGFQKMYEILEEYSLQAPNLQLKEILDSIKGGYAELEKTQKNKIQLLERKKESPQSFSEEIERQKTKLEEYKNLLYKGENEIETKYSGVTSKHYINLNESVVRHISIIRECKSLSLIRKSTTDAINTFQNHMNQFSNGITSDLHLKMEAVTMNFEAKYTISVPKIDLKAIEVKAKENAYRTEDIIGDRADDFWDKVTFRLFRRYRDNKIKVGEEEVFDDEMHLQNIKDQLYKDFKDIKTELETKSKEIFDRYRADYETEINNVIKKQVASLNELNDRKLNNDEIISEISILKKKISAIPLTLKSVEEIINDIT